MTQIYFEQQENEDVIYPFGPNKFLLGGGKWCPRESATSPVTETGALGVGAGKGKLDNVANTKQFTTGKELQALLHYEGVFFFGMSNVWYQAPFTLQVNS